MARPDNIREVGNSRGKHNSIMSQRPELPGSGPEGQSINSSTEKEVIGFGILKNQWVQMAAYIVLLAVMLILKPPFWLSLILIDVYIVLKAAYEKRLKLKNILRSLAYADGMLIIIYIMYWIVGGIWTVVLAHIVIGGMIIYGQWKFIMKAWTDLKYCLDRGVKEPRRRQKEWLESQKSIRKQ